MVAATSRCIHGNSAERAWKSMRRELVCPYCRAKEEGQPVHRPTADVNTAACGTRWHPLHGMTTAAPPHLEFVTCAACRALAETPTAMTQEKPMSAEVPTNTTNGIAAAPPPAPAMTTRPRGSLVTKLAEVMGLVHRVAKNGRNEFHKYDYATESDIAEAVRDGMAERHLMLVPNVKKTKWREVPGKNGPQQICTLYVRFSVHDGDTGEVMEFNALGEGQDSGDKATYKAMTGAVKYALLKLFLIPTGDDPENEQPAPRAAKQKAQPAPEIPAEQQHTNALLERVAKAASIAALDKLWEWAKGKQDEKKLYAALWDKVVVAAFEAQRVKLAPPAAPPAQTAKVEAPKAPKEPEAQPAPPAEFDQTGESNTTSFDSIMKTFDESEAERSEVKLKAAGQAIRAERKAGRLTEDQVGQLTARGASVKAKLAKGGK